jgi:hypothetical protein
MTAGTNTARKLLLDRRADQLLALFDAEGSCARDTAEVAEMLSVSKEWLTIGRHQGYGPPFVRLSHNCVRYLDRDVNAWLDERRHRSTAEYDAKLKRRGGPGRGHRGPMPAEAGEAGAAGEPEDHVKAA